MSDLIGKVVRITSNLSDHIGYEGQQVTIIDELEDDYIIVTDGIHTWHAGIEETDIFEQYDGV